MKGRTALYELMPISSEIKEMIVRGASISELRQAGRALGMKTLRESGITKVLEGTTTVEEMLRVTLV